MKKLKVMTVVGTRPEIIRLSAVINKLEQIEAIEHILVHTGQNYDYELNEVFFEDFKLKKPDYFLNAATGTPVETIGNILVNIDPILDEVQPDAFLVLGDTNSCLCAIAAVDHSRAWEFACASAKPFLANTFVIAAVKVVLPWSTCPIVPFIQWIMTLTVRINH